MPLQNPSVASTNASFADPAISVNEPLHLDNELTSHAEQIKKKSAQSEHERLLDNITRKMTLFLLRALAGEKEKNETAKKYKTKSEPSGNGPAPWRATTPIPWKVPLGYRKRARAADG